VGVLRRRCSGLGGRRWQIEFSFMCSPEF
jgi:hypothetical protein